MNLNLTYSFSLPGTFTNLPLEQDGQKHLTDHLNSKALHLATGIPPPPRNAYLGGFLPASIYYHRKRACAAMLATWYLQYPS